MLSKANLTLHSKISGSRWLIIPSWLFWWWRSFLYSSVYPCHHFFISSASVRLVQLLYYFEPICVWNLPLVSLIFLKGSLVFPILFFSSIYLHWSLRKAFLSLFPVSILYWCICNILSVLPDIVMTHHACTRVPHPIPPSISLPFLAYFTLYNRL